MRSYVGTKAELEAKEKGDRIYYACLLNKGAGVDTQVPSLHDTVMNTCSAIAEDPSWLEEFKYD